MLDTGCPAPPSTASAGNAQISAQVEGKGSAKLVVIHAKDKTSGAPVQHANVSIHSNMTCPHFMPLYTKRLKETSKGTYKGGYNFIMQGQWTVFIVLRAKSGDATTSALPITVTFGR